MNPLFPSRKGLHKKDELWVMSQHFSPAPFPISKTRGLARALVSQGCRSLRTHLLPKELGLVAL